MAVIGERAAGLDWDVIIEAVEAGASRREVIELFGSSPSVVVIWAQG